MTGPCHIRRIEGGFLSLGNDMDFNTNPFEVGYGFEETWMVDLDQEADFVGKEALKRIKAEGVRRKLVGVEIGGDHVGYFSDGTMPDYFPVFDKDSGEQVGRVTSASLRRWSMRHGTRGARLVGAARHRRTWRDRRSVHISTTPRVSHDARMR